MDCIKINVKDWETIEFVFRYVKNAKLDNYARIYLNEGDFIYVTATKKAFYTMLKILEIKYELVKK